MSEVRTRLLQFVQYGLGIGILVWVLNGADLGRIAGLIVSIPPVTLVVVVVVSLLGLFARFYTWLVLIRSGGILAAAKIDLSVNFINQLLPSRLSGRSAAPFVVRSQTKLRWTEAFAVTGLHTAAYALLYGCVSTIGLVIGYRYFSPPVVILVGLSTTLYLAAGTVILLAGIRLPVLDEVVVRLTAFVQRLPAIGDRLASVLDLSPSFTSETSASLRSLLRRPSVLLAYAVGWAVTIGIVPAIRVWLLLTAFGADFRPLVLLPFFLVAAYSVTLLPITPGGIGVTEATATVVFVSLGLPETTIVSVILLDRILGVYLPALAGWYPTVRMELGDLVSG